MSQAIEVVDLVKQFGRVRAVDGVTFEVPRGQFCALLGPNGAGKTTILHTLLGLTTPTEGSVRVLGHDLARERTAAVARTNFTASYVHFPWRMTIAEVLRVYAELYEVPEPKSAIEEVIDLAGISEFLDQQAQTLSSGQQTLVGLAKSLLNKPELLFLDEPTASLDPENAFELRRVLKDVSSARAMTVLITSHNMQEIERLADRILFLSRGRLVADATAGELRDKFKAADLEEVFLQMARDAKEEMRQA